MFGSKSRRITVLELKVDGLVDELDEVKKDRDDARWLVTRQAGQATDQSARAYDELGEWSAAAVDHAVRVGRLVRGCARYRQEIGRLLKLNAEQEQMLSDPRFAADRAIRPAAPTPEVERLRRDLRRVNALLELQQEQISRYQVASEDADKAVARAVKATVAA